MCLIKGQLDGIEIQQEFFTIVDGIEAIKEWIKEGKSIRGMTIYPLSYFLREKGKGKTFKVIDQN